MSQLQEELKTSFTLVTKRIIKENLTTNIGKHKEYIRDLIPAYNAIVTFYKFKLNSGVSEEILAQIKVELKKYKARFAECLRRLKIELELGTNLLSNYTVEPFIKIIDDLNEANNSVLSASQINESDSDEEKASGFDPNLVNTPQEQSESQNTKENSDHNSQNQENVNSEFQFPTREQFEARRNANMNNAFSIPDFMRLCTQSINQLYSGDPLSLKTFIGSIEYLELVATTDELRETLRHFIFTRLSGSALEAIPENAANIAEIKTALKAKIKPDSSKVIAGRMMALKLDNRKIQDYSKQAEELAESFRRSLIVEGITQSKANEMTVDKTIEMCRASAKSNLVKSVLAAATFENSKEVIARLITETATDTSEKQVFAYQKFTKNNNRQNNGNRNGNGYRRYNNNNNNQNTNNNNNNRFNGRGRGNSRGRNNYGYRNNNNNQNNGRNNWQNNNNNFVRYAENVPQQQVSLGFPNQQNHQVQNNQ